MVTADLDLNEELRLLNEAAHASREELRLLNARLREGHPLSTLSELHDVKAQITYLRLLLRQVADLAARLASADAPLRTNPSRVSAPRAA